MCAYRAHGIKGGLKTLAVDFCHCTRHAPMPVHSYGKNGVRVRQLQNDAAGARVHDRELARGQCGLLAYGDQGLGFR